MAFEYAYAAPGAAPGVTDRSASTCPARVVGVPDSGATPAAVGMPLVWVRSSRTVISAASAGSASVKAGR